MQSFLQELVSQINDALDQLKRWQTWLTLGLLALFGGLAFIVGRLAFQTDSVLVYLRLTVMSCGSMTDGMIVFLFCGTIFFVFLSVLTLGELQQYLQFRQRMALRQAKQAMHWGLGFGGSAIAIALAALFFFNSNCS